MATALPCYKKPCSLPPTIPRTKSGKMVELVVRDIVPGRPFKNKEALADPVALDLDKDLPKFQS